MRSDEELLRAFVAHTDRDALGALVERHRDAVYDLARHVAADSTLAEDATQEAFVRLLRSARQFRPTTSFRAWLLRLARNATLDLLRARRTRVRHEAEAARPPEAPAAPVSAPAEHAEVRVAVAGLDDELRLPVVLHFFRGLSHAEVGEVLGCPAGTVASRIHRAKEELRRRFAGLAGGAALAWESALRPEPAAAAPAALANRLGDWVAAASPPPVPGLLASAGGLAAIGVGAVIVAGAIGIGVWARGGGTDPSDQPSSDPAATLGATDTNRAPVEGRPDGAGRGRSTPAVADARDPVDAPLRAEDESGAPGLGVIRLRVVEPTGAPVVGARVALHHDWENPIDPAWAEDDPRRMRTCTDTDGVARLPVAFGGVFDEATVTVWVRAQGLAPAALTLVPVRAGETRDAGDVTLRPGQTCTGRVVDADRAPLAGVPVWAEPDVGHGVEPYQSRLPAGWAPSDAVRTDADGRFTLPHAPAGPGAVVALVADAVVLACLLPETPESVVELRAPALTTLRGRVVGPHPRADLRASFSRGLRDRWVPVARDGSFDLGHVPLGQGSASVWGADGARWGSVPLDTRVHEGPVEVEIEPPCEPGRADTVQGVVVDAATGSPLTRFAVALYPVDAQAELSASLSIWPEEVRDPEGRFALPGVRPGRYVVWARARGRAGARLEIDVHPDRALAPVRLALGDAGPDLVGRVRRADGSPVAGAIVTPSVTTSAAHPWAGLLPPTPPHSAVRTDGQGSFRLRFLGNAPVGLWARDESLELAPSAVAAVTPGGEPVEITLWRAPRLRVAVRDEQGTPVAEAEVRIEAISADGTCGHSQVDRADSAGNAETRLLTPGRYRVSLSGVDAAAWPGAARVVDVPRAGEVDVALSGPRPRTDTPPTVAPPLPRPAADGSGQVVGVSEQFNLVMVGLGEGDGVVAGSYVRVERDGQPVARLRVDRVFPGMSSAITVETYDRGAVQRGDRVVLER